jgi:hypothetical protein
VEQAKRRVSAVPAVGPRGGAERIGSYLARQRELRGISLDDLAFRTRIPLRSLQRLEGGAFDLEPDGFARGFVRTVAIALGLPPDETIARMLPEAQLRDASRLREVVRRGLVLLAAVVLLAAGMASIGWLARGGGPSLAPVFQARDDGLVVRRDAVTALAAEHGLLGAPPPRPPSETGQPASAREASARSRQGAEGGAQRAEGERRSSVPKASEVNRLAPAPHPDRAEGPMP